MAKRWLSVLEASFLVMSLRPHYNGFNKRLTKSQNLSFIDTGHLYHLLRIRSPDEIVLHSSSGAIFESFVLVEFLKGIFHRGLEPELYFWRDSDCHEVGVLIEQGAIQVPLEI